MNGGLRRVSWCAWRSASLSRKTASSCERAYAKCWRRSPRSKSWLRVPTCGRCSRRWKVDEGIRAAAQLRETHPGVGVVVLSQYAEPGYALALLESGSDRRAYLLKERVHDAAELVSTIKTVAQGGSVIDPKIVEVLVTAKARAERSPLSELTPREREVLAEIAQGKSNTAIAESLVLTKRAVEKHINSIFLKLDLSYADDVSRRVKAALLFLAEQDGPTGR
jgi:DNA-binding NarL/FixJ family response regulator